MFCFAQVSRQRGRPAGLRASAGAVRNGAEMADAYAKRIEAQYSGRSQGKDSELNKRLRRDELEETGRKREKCLRLASFLIRKGLGLEHA